MIKCVCLVEEKNHQLLLVQVRHRDKYYFRVVKLMRVRALWKLYRELKEELRLELAKDELEFIGTIVGEAYPQPNMLTELNGFKVNRAIDWSKVETDHEITDMKWFDINDSENIAPAVNTWIKEFIND